VLPNNLKLTCQRLLGDVLSVSSQYRATLPETASSPSACGFTKCVITSTHHKKKKKLHALGKPYYCRVLQEIYTTNIKHSANKIFTVCLIPSTWQQDSLPSVVLLHSAKLMFAECRNCRTWCRFLRLLHIAAAVIFVIYLPLFSLFLYSGC